MQPHGSDAQFDAEHSRAAKGFRRAILLLKELAYTRGGHANLTQLSHATELPMPTVHRLVGILLEERLIERVPDSRSFRLGPLVYELGIAEASLVRIKQLCAPSLERLKTTTGEASFLNCCSEGDAICLDRRQNSGEFQAVPVHIGNRRPLGVGASSLALLANQSQEKSEATILSNAARYTRYRLTPDRVFEEVARVRERGFAVTYGRLVPSFCGIALAVDHSPNNSPLALSVISLGDGLTSARIDRTVALLREEETLLRERLGPHQNEPGMGSSLVQ